MKLVLWFEPERVYAGTWLYTQRPQWLLGRGPTRLLNLGIPEARAWLTEHIDRFITEQGVDLYRQDFNIQPLPYWRANDAPDRQGITEIRHVEGYLAFWDELRRRHPGMLIDSCASGGRRNDLETLRRAVPLLRSDYQAPQNPNGTAAQRDELIMGNQGHTYGLAMWVPFYGTGEYYKDAYSFRSHLCPSQGVGGDCREPSEWKALQKVISDWRSVAKDFYGDYYPLTAYSLGQEAWMAWQFNRPEEGTGFVQVFRRSESAYETARFRLRGLDASASYQIRSFDEEAVQTVAGKELLEKGLPVSLPQPRSAVVLAYKRAN